MERLSQDAIRHLRGFFDLNSTWRATHVCTTWKRIFEGPNFTPFSMAELLPLPNHMPTLRKVLQTLRNLTVTAKNPLEENQIQNFPVSIVFRRLFTNLQILQVDGKSAGDVHIASMISKFFYGSKDTLKHVALPISLGLFLGFAIFPNVRRAKFTVEYDMLISKNAQEESLQTEIWEIIKEVFPGLDEIKFVVFLAKIPPPRPDEFLAQFQYDRQYRGKRMLDFREEMDMNEGSDAEVVNRLNSTIMEKIREKADEFDAEVEINSIVMGVLRL